MTQAAANAALMDREVQRLAAQSLRESQRLLRSLGAEMVRAFRGGDDPVRAVQSFYPKFADLLGRSMAAGHVQGRYRSLLVTARARKNLSLSSTYDEAVKIAERRLDLTPEDVATIRVRYGNVATTYAGQLRDKGLQFVEKAAAQAIRDQLSTSAAIQQIREALDSAGLSVSNPYAIENIFRTSVGTAYSAGRWNANEAPEIQEILWGYEYSSVLDDRTTENICVPLDGMRRPKNDPVWQRLWPLNHFGCRAQTIEVFNDEPGLAVPTPVPDVTAMPGFGFNPGVAYADALTV